MTRPRATLAIVTLAVLAAGAAGFAQGGRNRRAPLQGVEIEGNTPYDGRFTFVRLRYDTGFGGGFGTYWFGHRRGCWSNRR